MLSILRIYFSFLLLIHNHNDITGCNSTPKEHATDLASVHKLECTYIPVGLTTNGASCYPYIS